ncbi:MAG: polysaccharide deacetylase family protein [Bacteroidia bacterium]
MPAIGFILSTKSLEKWRSGKKTVDLLQMWLDAGMDLGNHAWSHMDYHTHDFEAFSADILKGEKITRPLVKASGRKYQYFRHPFLHTGNSPEKQKALQTFLKSNGYKEAPVTVDNSEWIYAQAYSNAIKSNDKQMMDSIGRSYVRYMEDKLAWYEQQSMKLFGREIRQILLIHANLINADYLDDLLEMMQNRGYKFVSLDEVLRDKAYKSESTFTGRGGISWLDRWALTQGYKGEFFKGEPTCPEFIQEVAGIRE